SQQETAVSTDLLTALRVVETEAVQRAVVGSDVHAAVHDAESGEVIERRDLFAARIQLVAGLAIEHVQRGVRRLRRADRRIEIQSDIWPRLFRFLAAAVAEHHAVGDYDGFAPFHVGRYPHRRQIQPAVPIAEPEAADAAGTHGSVRHFELELRVDRAPEGRQDPSVAEG